MQMKRLVSGLGATLLMLTMFGGCSTAKQAGSGKITYIQPYTTENDPYGYSYETVAQQNGLTLAINPDTTDISVTVESTGYTWSTANTRAGDTNFYPILSMDYSSEDGKALTKVSM